jgi:HNH endonuclease
MPTGVYPRPSFESRMAGFARQGPGCWDWQRAVNSVGYGRIARNGTRVYAHRAAYELAYGPIPKDMCVLHSCDNRRCVRPDHLFLGTKRDNMLDMAAKGRWRNQYAAGAAA